MWLFLLLLLFASVAVIIIVNRKCEENTILIVVRIVTDTIGILVVMLIATLDCHAYILSRIWARLGSMGQKSCTPGSLSLLRDRGARTACSAESG